LTETPLSRASPLPQVLQFWLCSGGVKASVECCSLLFIVNRRSVQLFSCNCSFLFSNERGFPFFQQIFTPDQSLAISGTNVALSLRLLDSK
ncbi:MAG: hypothetical protein ABIO21_13805, partial [Pseudomonas sp.]